MILQCFSNMEKIKFLMNWNTLSNLCDLKLGGFLCKFSMRFFFAVIYNECTKNHKKTHQRWQMLLEIRTSIIAEFTATHLTPLKMIKMWLQVSAKIFLFEIIGQVRKRTLVKSKKSFNYIKKLLKFEGRFLSREN